jgi:hypothetical protein
MGDIELSTEDMLRRLEARYAPPEWVTIRECSDSTGYRSRSADLMAFGLWPSRGMEIIGFEVKSFRGDWIKEIKNPAKAETIASRCDRWYVVVTNEKIIQPGELPGNWGVIIPRGAGLKISVEAEYSRKGDIKRNFFMAMLRRVVDGTVPKILFQEKLDEAFKQKEKDLREQLEWKNKNNEEQYKSLLEKIDEFEKASGVKLGERWESGKNIGEAVKFVLNHNPQEHMNQLKWLSERLKSIANEVDLDIENFGVSKEAV